MKCECGRRDQVPDQETSGAGCGGGGEKVFGINPISEYLESRRFAGSKIRT